MERLSREAGSALSYSVVERTFSIVYDKRIIEIGFLFFFVEASWC